ncbi:hypothetical protein GYMLUDRAFT_45293 [Collybiopsis luxurians FD-317 M1]|uniref:Uncharacterized protein n=1 Tax=Collybiopsis luxurians FD-317 M1 TaxID=944289 RepID=A0A0D0BSQ7_9AGAR|nr:hypothetical protein GYMLUDRAFT_45293 [Collybiopsis luxurians FD-317 M1]
MGIGGVVCLCMLCGCSIPIWRLCRYWQTELEYWPVGSGCAGYECGAANHGHSDQDLSSLLSRVGSSRPLQEENTNIAPHSWIDVVYNQSPCPEDICCLRVDIQLRFQA